MTTRRGPHNQTTVPVLDRYGQPLAPARPSRVRHWLESGRATKVWVKGIFAVQIHDRAAATSTKGNFAFNMDPGETSGIAITRKSHDGEHRTIVGAYEHQHRNADVMLTVWSVVRGFHGGRRRRGVGAPDGPRRPPRERRPAPAGRRRWNPRPAAARGGRHHPGARRAGPVEMGTTGAQSNPDTGDAAATIDGQNQAQTTRPDSKKPGTNVPPVFGAIVPCPLFPTQNSFQTGWHKCATCVWRNCATGLGYPLTGPS